MVVEVSWATCDDCRRRFQVPGAGMAAFGPAGSFRDFKVGPCPRCGGVGAPIAVRTGLDHDGNTVISTNNLDPQLLLSTLFVALRQADVPAEEAATILEQAGTAGAALAKWVRAHHLAVAAWAAVVLAALMPMMESPGITPEQVEQIVEEVLENLSENDG